LLFIDEEYGQPIIPVDGKFFEIEGAQVDLDLSQIRTFRYASYNSKRQSRDADRFGIEKGSVICINRAISKEEIDEIKKGIGLYLNEGFGKVLINPEFLRTTKDTLLGESVFSIKPIKKDDSEEVKIKSSDIIMPETLKEKAVFLYLKRSLKAEEDQEAIYSKVNEFVENNKTLFENSSEQFASQWGTIRTKAMQVKTKQELHNALFSSDGYLMTGQSATKWKETQKRNLNDFITGLDDPIALKTMINLSAEMAKKCKKGGIQ